MTKKVNSYVRRDTILDENIQNGYSLALGQCTELLKSKLKTTSNWDTISTDFDLIGLIASIKSVILKSKINAIFHFRFTKPRQTFTPSGSKARRCYKIDRKSVV